MFAGSAGHRASKTSTWFVMLGACTWPRHVRRHQDTTNLSRHNLGTYSCQCPALHPFQLVLPLLRVLVALCLSSRAGGVSVRLRKQARLRLDPCVRSEE